MDTVNPKPILRDVAGTVRKRYGLKRKPRATNIYHVKSNDSDTDPTYTVVIIPTVGGTAKAIGVAKRNPKDKYNPETGIRIAYSRALKNLSTIE